MGVRACGGRRGGVGWRDGGFLMTVIELPDEQAAASFAATGAWYPATYNSGGGTASGETVNGPYYHAWGTTCNELDSGPGNAVWNLGITQDGTYTLEVWL